ncbi:MAG: AI-2E family transporter [Mycoplasmatales bacterium]
MKDKINFKLINIILFILLVFITFLFLDYINIEQIIGKVLNTLLPFLIGFFLSWLLLPLSEMLQKKLKFSKKAGNATAILISILIIIGFLFLIIPQLILEIINLSNNFQQIGKGIINNMPRVVEFYDDNKELLTTLNIDTSSVIGYIKESFITITSTITIIFSGVLSFFSFIVQIILGYVVAFYFIGTIKDFVKGLINLVNFGDKVQNKKLIVKMSKNLFAYVRGVLIISTVVATIMTIGVSLIGISEPLLFGVISGITNIIPYLGPILGGIPIFIVALSLGYKQALLVVVLICIVQFVESNFLQPKIMSKSTDLHPVTIMCGLLLFGSFWGLIGMMLATPVLATINVYIKHSKYAKKIKL